MKLARIIAGLWVISALLGAPHPTCAEEITLKEGQEIVGTIVGYENDMFQVETAYGFALVRKDKVASIQVTKPDAANPRAPQRPTLKIIGQKPTHVVAAREVAPAAAPSANTPPEPPPPPGIYKIAGSSAPGKRTPDRSDPERVQTA